MRNGATYLDQNMIGLPDPNENPLWRIMVLCDNALTRGIASDTTASVATLRDLSEVQHGLYHGKTLDDICFAVTLSALVTHELFHVAYYPGCKFSQLHCSTSNGDRLSLFPCIVFSGTDETYGWYSSRGLGPEKSLMNVDNYVFYAVGVSFPSCLRSLQACSVPSAFFRKSLITRLRC